MKKRHKIKRFFKKNPYTIPFFIILGIFLAALFVYLTPSVIQYISSITTTHEGDDSTTTYTGNVLTIEDYNDYTSLSEISHDYEDIIFVHHNGDNSTGGYDWDHAYTDLPSALARANVNGNDTTLILVGAGIFDVCNPIAQVIARNVILMGLSRDATTFINTHPLATSVFRAEWMFSGYSFMIQMEDTCDGIVIGQDPGHSEVENDVQLTDIKFMVNVTNNGNPTGLIVEETEHGEFDHLEFHGFSHGGIIGMNVSNSSHSNFNDIIIHDATDGIMITSNSSNGNFFTDISIVNATIGINIDNGTAPNHFLDIDLMHCVTNIDDEIGVACWARITTHDMTTGITPNNLIGVDVDTNVAANVYGADTLVFDGIGIDTPFYLTAILFEPDAGERYGLRIWSVHEETYVYETVLEGIANQINRFIIEIPRIFTAHDRIFISIRSETGGDDMDIWLEVLSL